MSDAIRALQKESEGHALLWVAVIMDDDDEIEAFVEVIPGYNTFGTSKPALTIVDDLMHSRRPSPLGRQLERLMTCVPEGYRSTSELVCHRCSTMWLDTLKRNEDLVVAINVVTTGVLAARAYLCTIFVAIWETLWRLVAKTVHDALPERLLRAVGRGVGARRSPA